MLADMPAQDPRDLRRSQPFRIGCRTPAVLLQELERARWGTWRHALNALVIARDEGYPVRSSADPRRFEVQVFDRYGGGDGDAGQRLAVELAPVAQALDAASASVFVEAPKVIAKELFITATCGKPYSYRAPGRKHATRLRTDVSIGEVAKAFDFEIHRALSIVLAVGQDFERRLLEKGHVAHATNWERDEHNMADADEHDLLKGWKNIADHVGLSIQTAIRAKEWLPPIPVREFGGRVEATRSALTSWKAAGASLPRKS